MNVKDTAVSGGMAGYMDHVVKGVTDTWLHPKNFGSNYSESIQEPSH
jgi:hypothetical protein